MSTMALTRDFRQTIVERVRRDPKFSRSLLDEAATLFLKGEPEAARLLLRDLVNATVGFEALAETTNRPAKSLHRILQGADPAEPGRHRVGHRYLEWHRGSR